ncbi:MAG: hypothetical protein ACLSEY_11940 [Enterocloster sp.]
MDAGNRTGWPAVFAVLLSGILLGKMGAAVLASAPKKKLKK